MREGKEFEASVGGSEYCLVCFRTCLVLNGSFNGLVALSHHRQNCEIDGDFTLLSLLLELILIGPLKMLAEFVKFTEQDF